MHKLARYYFTFLFLLGIGYKGFGQVRHLQQPPGYQQRVIRPNQNGLKKIEVVRENYVSKRLSLSSDQSVKFWPLYRRYQDALTAVRRLKRQNNSNTQADGSQQIQNELYYEGEIVNIRKFYTDEFLKILPPEKVSELFKAEREFTDELIKQLRERSQPVKN